jgi:predicted amidohydrolase YtcJ
MGRRFGLVNAHVWTQDPAAERAEAVWVEDGRIADVGDEKKIMRRAAKDGGPVTDLQGRTLLPGLIDSHTHLIHQGLLRSRVDLHETKSLGEALRLVAKAVKRLRPGQTLLAERWDESRWKERRRPSRDDLDAISTKVPIILRRVDGHFAVANGPAAQAVAQKLTGVDVENGLLVEEASLNLNQIFPASETEATDALEYAQKEALRLGVTTVHDFVVPAYLRAYQQLHRHGRLRIRAHVTPYVEYLDPITTLGLQTGWGDDRLRLGGIKLFADGSLGGHTAALRSPYADQPDHQGRLIWPRPDLHDRIRRAHAGGLQVSAHAIGDAAIDEVLSAYRDLGPSARARRHRVEHFELHAPEHHQMMRDLGAIASMQPNFVGQWSKRGGMYDTRLGKRHRRNNEFERLRRDGVRLAFGSDCMPFDPWFGLAACTSAPYGAQRMRLTHAIEAYTRGSAFGLHREGDLGILKKGAFADMVLVDWQDARPKDLARTTVLTTWVDGRIEHQAPKPRDRKG